jgi:hypothetical protein
MQKNETSNQHKQRDLIKQKLQEHNSVLAEAVKRKIMVIIDKETLDEKVTQFRSDNQIDMLKADPIQKMHTQIQNTLKPCNTLIDQLRRNYILNMNPKASTLKAKIKIPSAPIIPVISNIYSPSYN